MRLCNRYHNLRRGTLPRLAIPALAALLLLLAAPLRTFAQATIESPTFASGGDLQQGSYGALFSTIGQAAVASDSLFGHDDMTTWTGFWRVQIDETPVGVVEKPLPDLYTDSRLIGSFPNPFSSTLEVDVAIARGSRVVLAVHDMLGREVCRLLDGDREAGTARLQWRPENLAAGSYVLRLTVDGVERSSAMVRYFK